MQPKQYDDLWTFLKFFPKKPIFAGIWMFAFYIYLYSRELSGRFGLWLFSVKLDRTRLKFAVIA